MSSTVSHSIAFKSAHNTYAKYVKTHTNTQDTEAETEKDTDKTCLENGIVVMIKLRIFILLPNFVKLRLKTLNVSLESLHLGIPPFVLAGGRGYNEL